MDYRLITGSIRGSNPYNRGGIVVDKKALHFWNTFVSVIQTGWG